MDYKIIKDLHKDNDWRVSLVFSIAHNNLALSVWKKCKKNYSQRRYIFLHEIQPQNKYRYFITTPLRKSFFKKEAKKSQIRFDLQGIQEEINSNIVNQQHLDILIAAHLMDFMNNGEKL